MSLSTPSFTVVSSALAAPVNSAPIAAAANRALACRMIPDVIILPPSFIADAVRGNAFGDTVAVPSSPSSGRPEAKPFRISLPR